MLEELVLSGFCLLAAVIALAVVAWEIITGSVFDIDGLWLALISLTLAAVFGGSLAWSCYTGEAQQMLRRLRKGSASKEVENSSTPK